MLQNLKVDYLTDLKNLIGFCLRLFCLKLAGNFSTSMLARVQRNEIWK